MKSSFINELRAGDEVVNEPFLLAEVSRRNTRDGRLYFLCSFADKTGQIGGIFWDVPNYINEWARPGLVVLVTGRVNEYKDALQLTATDMNPLPEPDMADFLPASQRPREEMKAELLSIIDSLASPWQEFVRHLLLQESFLNSYVNSPAARQMHHAFIGGLLEHTLSMAKTAVFLAQHYAYVNKDLLLAGVLLHDMGKVYEYNLNGQFDYSEDGRLVGHIVRAIVEIEKAAAATNLLTEDQLRQLIHLVASHHGTQEWGSPVVPRTLEAILLHQIDLLDSRVQGFLDHLESDQIENGWTVKHSPMFKTVLRQPDGMEIGD
ncbi:MAG: HD domain-containing protein [Candidatus Promineifilaceae bacterium]